jgi:peptide deformylase
VPVTVGQLRRIDQPRRPRSRPVACTFLEDLVSIRPIRLFGDPVLRTPADPVATFDAELRKLVKDLTDTMMDAPGVGLAAPQIGVGLRVFTYFVDDVVGHLINPSLQLSEQTELDDEGCLSFPGLAYPTNRAFGVVATGFDMHGEPVTVEGTGQLARCVQHETDHLDGVLFIDRLDAAQRKLAMKEIRASESVPLVKVSPHPTHGKVF